MPQISATVVRYADIDVDIELDDFVRQLSEEERAELREQLAGKSAGASPSLELIYEEFARRGDAPKVLRDYLYETIGRIL